MIVHIRWTISFLIVGVLPLTLINVMGVHYDGNGDHHVYTVVWDVEKGTYRRVSDWGERPRNWTHGWPLSHLLRTGERPIARAARRYWQPTDPPELPPATSRWPFDEAPRFWARSWLRELFNVCVWSVLLIGTGLAAARSRFVETGKLQFGLATYLVAVSFFAAYLGAYANGLVTGWERVILLPVLTSATVGYASLLRECCIARMSWGRGPSRPSTATPTEGVQRGQASLFTEVRG